MDAPESVGEHAERLTDIFGYWPSFHDAEVLEMHLWRGDVHPDREEYVFPVLTVKLYLWEMTGETNAKGELQLRHHTLATLRFHDLSDDLELTGFNHENAIYGLRIERRQRHSGPSPYLAVEMESGFGVGARFTCLGAEVLDAVPCDEEGRPT